MKKTFITKHSPRKVFKSSLIVLTSLFVGLLLCEVILRVAGLSWPIFYQQSDDLGGELRPGASGIWTVEGNGSIKINSDGLRDEEHSEIKPKDVWRIAILGDSYAEALQVDLDETFWSIMENELVECPKFSSKKVEAINFGVSGYGTGQQLITLRKKVWKYEPDMVLLAVTTGNDIRNNSKKLEPKKMRPFFNRDGNKLVLDNSFTDLLKPSWLEFFMDKAKKFRLYQMMRYVQLAINNGSDELDEATENNSFQEMGLDKHVFAPPKDEIWIDAWWITEKLISQMHKEVVDNGSKFFVVSLTSGIQVNPDPLAREDFAAALGVEDLSYPDKRLAALSELEGFSFLSLLEPFIDYADLKKEFLHGFSNAKLGTGHWNQRGHELAGSLIAKDICNSKE